MKNLIVAFFLSAMSVIGFAQSSGVDMVYKVRNGLYCTASSGDGWYEVTFSKTPGRTKHYIGMNAPYFKDAYFTLEYTSVGLDKYSWLAYVKDRFVLAKVSEQEIKRCFNAVKYDDYFMYYELKQKPSAVFSKKTTEIIDTHPQKAGKKK